MNLNKYVYGIVIFLIALLVTLGAVYYFNKGSMNKTSDMNKNTTSNVTAPAKSETSSSSASVIEGGLNPAKAQIIVDESTPKNYNNSDLINLEKEINSLDISDQPDIQ